ncbi:hypothetical protein [Methylocystis iwaonis]|uniref:hypothetical protein n=1 Tax=Methylocystis iwaonis TaxID=2885079 RepID=UPI0024936B0B|nr:hypothetical protein [Methylocystis iwaonis]
MKKRDKPEFTAGGGLIDRHWFLAAAGGFGVVGRARGETLVVEPWITEPGASRGLRPRA